MGWRPDAPPPPLLLAFVTPPLPAADGAFALHDDCWGWRGAEEDDKEKEKAPLELLLLLLLELDGIGMLAELGMGEVVETLEPMLVKLKLSFGMRDDTGVLALAP